MIIEVKNSYCDTAHGKYLSLYLQNPICGQSTTIEKIFIMKFLKLQYYVLFFVFFFLEQYVFIL